MSALGNLTVSLALDHTNFSTGLSKSEHDAKKSADAIGRQFTVLKASFASLTGVLVGGSFTAWVKSSIDAADNMRDLAIATGTNVQSLASYELAAKQSGTTIEAVAAGMGKLTLFMAKNADEAKRLGITAQDPAQAMTQLAAVLEKAATPADRNAIANQALGKSYAELMPLLAQGSAELRAQIAAAEPYAKKMAEMADKADTFNDQMERLSQYSKSAGLSLANVLLPALNNVIEQMNEGSRIFGSFWAAAEVGTRNPFKSAGDHLKSLRADLTALEEKKAGIKPSSVSHILIAGIDEDIAKTKKFIEYYKVMRAQSLGLKSKSELAAEARQQRADTSNALKFKSEQDKSDADKARSDRLAAQKKAAKMAVDTMKYEFDAAMEVEDYRIEQETKRKLAEREAARQIASTGFAGDSETMDMIRQQAEQISQFYSQIASGEDVTAAFEASQARLNSIRTRLDAEVGIGLKSQTAAQIELRQETGKLGDELASRLLPRLNDLIAVAPDAETREKWRALYAEIGGMQATGKQVGPFAGLQAGLNEYAQTSTDTFATARDAATRAFKGMEDSLASFVKTGKLDFKSLAGSIIDDLLRIQLRASITGPLASLFGSFAGGGTQTAAPIVDHSFASGGIMSASGALPLHRYASGGIANRPQLALFGEGRMNEAFVPLPDGRRIPVAMSGDGGGVSIVQHISIDSRSDKASIMQAMQQAKNAAVAEINNSLMRGGRTAKLAGVA